MIVTPILAVVAWFAVDYYVAERPHQMKANGSYTLQEKPSCRWGSGGCILSNNDVEFSFRAHNTAKYNTLVLISSIEIDAAHIALVTNKEEHSTPVSMLKQQDNTWIINIEPVDNNQFLQLVFSVGNTQFYAVVPTIWINKEELPYEQQYSSLNEY